MEHLSVMGLGKQIGIRIQIKRVNLLIYVNLALVFFVSLSLEYVLKFDAFITYLVMLLLFTWLLIVAFVKYLLILDVALRVTNNLKNLESSDVNNLKMIEKYLQALELCSMINIFIILFKAYELTLIEFSVTSVYVLLSLIVIFFVFSFVELILQMKILHRTSNITWHIFRGMRNDISANNITLKKQDYISEFMSKTYVCVSASILIVVAYFDTMQTTITVTNWILAIGLIIFIIHELIYRIYGLR